MESKITKSFTVLILLLGIYTINAQTTIQNHGSGLVVNVDTDASGNESMDINVAQRRSVNFGPFRNTMFVNTVFNGNIGSGISNPSEGIHLLNRNIRVDGGQYQSFGPIILHPDVDNTGDDSISFRNSRNGEMASIQDGELTIGDIRSNGDLFNNRVLTGDLFANNLTMINGERISSNGNLIFRPDFNSSGDDDRIIFKNTEDEDMATLQDGVLTLSRVILDIGSFPDYVFDASYDLMPLVKVSEYIKENKHLPNMPSEAEVVANGMSVGQINTILVEKVEELTLYTIDQENEIDDLRKKVKDQNERIDHLLKKLQIIETQLNN
ncbi:hypothetical protein [Aquimarina sp. 2201CG5-10]|uniref:hypothetical protein n=1 Tax=Aquimarina callyspongiae TaxID=3098150 RepID=UPI002AB42D1E|nr:hypothetical protein [Aquimarina sp. 2201CG5-10]MDY8135753.1 hypothetical protein [Aquimarina sp. 2201CG5-10]